jgi:hypothetical protein
MPPAAWAPSSLAARAPGHDRSCVGHHGTGISGGGTDLALVDDTLRGLPIIHVAAVVPGSTSFTRGATVGLRGTAQEGEQPWQILTRDQP